MFTTCMTSWGISCWPAFLFLCLVWLINIGTTLLVRFLTVHKSTRIAGFDSEENMRVLPCLSLGLKPNMCREQQLSWSIVTGGATSRIYSIWITHKYICVWVYVRNVCQASDWVCNPWETPECRDLIWWNVKLPLLSRRDSLQAVSGKSLSYTPRNVCSSVFAEKFN